MGKNHASQYANFGSLRQISVFTEELLKLSLEQPRITAWDVYNVATEIYKPGKTDFPAMIPQNGAMADFLLSYNQN